MGTKNRVLLGLIIAFSCCLLTSESAADSQQILQTPQSQIKRLILTDGSYELISQYSVQGDRVRYFSSERHAWEEMPYSMVDWTATEKYASQELQETDERLNESRKRAAEERHEKEARTPLIAAGVRLPSSDGVFLLNFYGGKPELNKLVQSGGDLNKNMGSNILRGIINPIASAKQTIELKGLRARIQSHVFDPALYFAIDPADAAMGYNSETAKDHLRLVRCKNKKGNRVVATVEIAVYGKVKLKAQYVETKIERISDYWVKIAPLTKLQTGEYALVEFDDKGSVNQYVWDFGVNATAPPNPAVVLVDPEKKEPVLKEKLPKATAP